MKKVLFLLCFLSCAFCTNLSAQENIEWGYYGGDGSDLGGMGASATSYGVAMFVPGDGLVKDGKIVGAKIPISKGSVITSLKAWITTASSLSKTMTYVREKDVPASDIPGGVSTGDKSKYYATVMFDEPFEIPSTGCFLGYNLTLTTGTADAYPVLVYQGAYDNKGLYLSAANVSSGAWAAYGSDYGVSGMKAIVSGVTLPDADVTFAGFENEIIPSKTKITAPLTVKSNSGKAVSSIEYKITLADKTETRTADVEIPAGYAKSVTLDVDLPDFDGSGEYSLDLQVLKVNGGENSSASAVTSSKLRFVSRKIARNTLVEEHTGTRCGWCPMGMVGMENMKKKYGDRFIGIAIHQFTTSTSQDAMYTSKYRKHGMTSAPDALFDNKYEMQPYEGQQYFNLVNDILPLVDINLVAEWTDDTKKTVKIDAEVEGLCAGNYTISYALTANNLQGTTSAWAQSNYLCQYTYSQVGGSDLAPYCKNGKYGQSTIYPVFNDVLIGSSYNASKVNQATALGSLTPENPVSNTYTITLPTTPTTLVSQLEANVDKIYAVAIVWDKYNEVAQAVKVPVTVPVGIEETKVDRKETKVGNTYNLAGQKVGEDYKGIIIKNGRKILR